MNVWVQIIKMAIGICRMLFSISVSATHVVKSGKKLFFILKLLWVFENTIPRRKFEPKRDENGVWRRLHKEPVYHSPNIVRVIKSRRLRWADHVTRMEEARSAFIILTDTLAGKRTLRRPRRR